MGGHYFCRAAAVDDSDTSATWTLDVSGAAHDCPAGCDWLDAAGANHHAPAATRIVAVGMFGFAAVAVVLILMPAYAPPRYLTDSRDPAIPARVEIRYGESLMLLGSSVRPHPVDPRSALEVDLYWRVLAPIDVDYSLNLAALDENFRVVGSRNSYPGHGLLPTRLMQEGQVFQETYWLPAGAPSGLVQVSVFERESQENMEAFDPAGNEITPIVNEFSLP